MSINIIERQLPGQYENYTIDTDRLRQRIQDKDKKDARSAGSDTVDISQDGRRALEERLLESIQASRGIKAEGRLVNVSPLRVFEDYEKAVTAEKRDRTAIGNFDRHVDKMVSAYQKMKRDIEEKYANKDDGQEQLYYVDDEKGIQKLTKESEIELLDRAYEQHSKAMAGFTESLSSLRDFKPQIRYHRAKVGADERPAQQAQTVLAGDVKWKKGAIRDQAYQAFMTAINRESAVSAGSELNGIWDCYAN